MPAKSEHGCNGNLHRTVQPTLSGVTEVQPLQPPRGCIWGNTIHAMDANATNAVRGVYNAIALANSMNDPRVMLVAFNQRDFVERYLQLYEQFVALNSANRISSNTLVSRQWTNDVIQRCSDNSQQSQRHFDPAQPTNGEFASREMRLMRAVVSRQPAILCDTSDKLSDSAVADDRR
ncbi:hypothetical protein G5I_07677 [Acromyrmex echinatior]|uniref:Uncharacterized protein n=1 Tax=Acromyrmex echinatior TaxID=103372 RepID=F4WPB4_ACREC|nr:hypothetical protein G5I_07677 [Acromyrmex echinatior]